MGSTTGMYDTTKVLDTTTGTYSPAAATPEEKVLNFLEQKQYLHLKQILLRT